MPDPGPWSAFLEKFGLPMTMLGVMVIATWRGAVFLKPLVTGLFKKQYDFVDSTATLLDRSAEEMRTQTLRLEDVQTDVEEFRKDMVGMMKVVADNTTCSREIINGNAAILARIDLLIAKLDIRAQT